MKTIILGAGLAGLSAAYHLKKNYKIFEKEQSAGGLCKSIKKRGFIFDLTGHLLHFHHQDSKKLIKKLLKNNLNKLKKNAWIYSNGIYTPYPFQSNTYGLPAKEIEECLIGLVKAKLKSKKDAKNFKEWIINHFGKGVAKYFMIPYNEKLFRTSVKEITTEWISKYIPKPNIKDFIIGALEQKNTALSYNDVFFYPKKGGINSLVKGFVKKIENLELNKEAKEIYFKRKKVVFRDGSSESYENLVSTLPLPRLIKILNNAPKPIKEAANKLNYVSVYNINFGVEGENKSDKHWIYFPEKKYPFYRVGFQSNFSKSCVPKGHYSIYTETSYSKKKPINKKKILKKIKNNLIEIGIINKKDKIKVTNINDIKYAYVIFDKNRKKAVEIIRDFLKKNKIFSIGRFGLWEYSEMESSILEGKEIAKKIS